MDMWLDQQNPLTLSSEEVEKHLQNIKKSKERRRKRYEIQSEACDVHPVVIHTGRTQNSNG